VSHDKGDLTNTKVVKKPTWLGRKLRSKFFSQPGFEGKFSYICSLLIVSNED
jgi:hypothetical protein